MVEMVTVEMGAALPYSVLLPMALIIYNKDRQRRLTITEARPAVPAPIAAWLIDVRKVAKWPAPTVEAVSVVSTMATVTPMVTAVEAAPTTKPSRAKKR